MLTNQAHTFEPETDDHCLVLVENMTTNQMHTSESEDDLRHLVYSSKSETDDHYLAENVITNQVHSSESRLITTTWHRM